MEKKEEAHIKRLKEAIENEIEEGDIELPAGYFLGLERALELIEETKIEL